MAEPARKLPLDDSANESTRPKLGLIKGGEEGGESSKPELNVIDGGRDKEDTGKEASNVSNVTSLAAYRERKALGFDNKDSDDSSDSISSEEQSLYKAVPAASRRELKVNLRKTGKNTAIVGGIIAAVVSVAIALLSIFLPTIKLDGYLSRINQRVFGAASSAVDNRVQRLFGHYMLAHVIQLDRCGNNVTIDCRADYTNKGIATPLYGAWQDAKIEQRLFDNLGIQVESHRNAAPGEPRFTLRDRMGREIRLTDGDIRAGRFNGGSREFGREISLFLRQETKWYEVMQRRSVRKYLDRKHNVKSWCFMFCKGKDRLEERNVNAKTKLKYKMVEKFIYPFSGKYGLIMDCITAGGSGPRCSSEGLRQNRINRNLNISDAEIDDILSNFRTNQGTRISQVLVKKLLSKIMSDASARAVTSAIPLVGQIYLAVYMIDMYDRMDSFIENRGLSKMAADLNSTQYLEWYTSMRTANDEIKSGVLGFDEVGALATEFEGAEKSRIYQARYGTAGSEEYNESDSTYRCANGEPIPVGQHVCKEKKVERSFAVEDWRNNKVVDGLAGVLNSYGRCPTFTVDGKCAGIRPRTVIRPILGAIDKVSDTVFGTVAKTLMDGIRYLPGVNEIFVWAESKVDKMLSSLFGKVLPLPIQIDSSGREKYDGLEAGGEFAAYEFCKGGGEGASGYGLGCRTLTDSELSAVQQEQQEMRKFEFRNSSLLARLTSLDLPNSLASSMARKFPVSFSGLASGIPTGIVSGINNFGINIASLLTKPVNAASDPINGSPFAIPASGYAVNDEDLGRSPEDFTPEFCAQMAARRENSRTENEYTGFDEYSETNPCLLEQAAVEVAGLYFTNE